MAVTIPCSKCNGSGEETVYYHNMFDDLVLQTPRAVWGQYIADGYTMREAIKSERSYQ